jgi:hypothetical protein
MRRSSIGWLVTLGALGSVAAGPAIPAQGFTQGPPPPYAICTSASMADRTALEASLGPGNGATVQAGTPVSFSGNSGAPVTFAVASSLASLYSPDIDSGVGSVQPGASPSTYAFTSTKASATPRTVYWDASFSDAGLAECAGLSPTIYTTQARTLTVLPAPTGGVATNKKQEEAAAKKKKEEEDAAAGAGNVFFVWSVGSGIEVQSGGAATFKLTCKGTDMCRGKLTLTVKPRGRGRKRGSNTTTIGTATFSIPPGKTTTIKLKLYAGGRALLDAAHGRLSANLTVLKAFPVPSQTHTESVQLVQRTAHGKARK